MHIYSENSMKKKCWWQITGWSQGGNCPSGKCHKVKKGRLVIEWQMSRLQKIAYRLQDLNTFITSIGIQDIQRLLLRLQIK